MFCYVQRSSTSRANKGTGSNPYADKVSNLFRPSNFEGAIKYACFFLLRWVCADGVMELPGSVHAAVGELRGGRRQHVPVRLLQGVLAMGVDATW